MNTVGHVKLVTGAAWAFIALGALGLIGTVPVALLGWFFVDTAAYAAAVDEALRTAPVAVPPWMEWTLRHLRGVMTASAIMCAGTVVVAIGLLRRNELARIVFVVMLWIGAAVHLIWAVAPFLGGVTAAGKAGLVLALASAVFALAFGVLYGWLAVVLSSAPVRAEFSQHGP